MKKSYVNETSLIVNVQIDLGEIAQLIDLADSAAEADEGSNWTAKDLSRKLKELRKEAMDEAKREFENLLNRV